MGESTPREPLARGRRRLLGFVGALVLLGLVTSQLDLRETDVAVYAKAAERVFVSDADPYPRRQGDVLPFTYPPTALALLYPIAGLSAAQVSALMLKLNLVLSLVAMLLIVGDLARDEPRGRLLLWGPPYIACFGGLYLNLVFGQVNLLLLLLLWGYWRALRRGRAGAGAGALLALGCIAKPHYALLAAAAGPRPGPRLLAGAFAAGAWLLLLSLWLAPPGSWGSWWREIAGATSVTSLPPGHSSIAAPWNRSVAGAVARFLIPNKFSTPIRDDPALAAMITTLLILVVVTVTVIVIARSMRRDLSAAGSPAREARGPTDHDLELSVLTIAVFLIAPASWTHHLVLLLPACLVLLRDAVLDPSEPNGSRLSASLVLAVIALTLDDLLARELRVASLPLMTLMTVGVAGLWLLLVERLWRRSGARPARS